MKCCAAVGSSASYHKIRSSAVALVSLAAASCLKQRTKPKHYTSICFFSCLCCKDLAAVFFTAEYATLSRALQTGPGNYGQFVQSLHMEAAYSCSCWVKGQFVQSHWQTSPF